MRSVETIADPQADTAARLLTWLSDGVAHISGDDIHMARVLGMSYYRSSPTFTLSRIRWDDGLPSTDPEDYQVSKDTKAWGAFTARAQPVPGRVGNGRCMAGLEVAGRMPVRD